MMHRGLISFHRISDIGWTVTVQRGMLKLYCDIVDAGLHGDLLLLFNQHIGGYKMNCRGMVALKMRCIF